VRPSFDRQGDVNAARLIAVALTAPILAAWVSLSRSWTQRLVPALTEMRDQAAEFQVSHPIIVEDASSFEQSRDAWHIGIDDLQKSFREAATHMVETGEVPG
jgi:hypothetical protein